MVLADRLGLDYQRWLAYICRPELETLGAYIEGTPAGYFELELQDEDKRELASYFGLLPQFIGLGIGGLLLTKLSRAHGRLVAAECGCTQCHT